MQGFWFTELLPAATIVSPTPRDRFVLNGHDPWAVIVGPTADVRGFCRIEAIWPDNVISHDGLTTLAKLVRQPARRMLTA